MEKNIGIGKLIFNSLDKKTIEFQFRFTLQPQEALKNLLELFSTTKRFNVHTLRQRNVDHINKVTCDRYQALPVDQRNHLN